MPISKSPRFVLALAALAVPVALAGASPATARTARTSPATAASASGSADAGQVHGRTGVRRQHAATDGGRAARGHRAPRPQAQPEG